MGYQNTKKVNTDATIRKGRLTVSEGVAPSAVIRPFPGLKTLWVDYTHKPFFESIILRGTVIASFYYDQAAGTKTRLKALYGMTDNDLSLDGAGNGEIPKGYYVVPCIGKAGYTPKKYTVAADGTVTAGATADNTAGDAVLFFPNNTLDMQLAKPIGVLTMDAYRPFSVGENEGVSFVCKQYIEQPIMTVTDGFDNSDLLVGTFVKPDALGRMVKWNIGDPEELRIGQVIEREDLANGGTGAGNADYDFGMLNYMLLPVGDTLAEAMIKEAYGTPFGVRGNLNDLAADGATVKGVVRINLLNL